jgi:hypothetical protein
MNNPMEMLNNVIGKQKPQVLNPNQNLAQMVLERVMTAIPQLSSNPLVKSFLPMLEKFIPDDKEVMIFVDALLNRTGPIWEAIESELKLLVEAHEKSHSGN